MEVQTPKQRSKIRKIKCVLLKLKRRLKRGYKNIPVNLNTILVFFAVLGVIGAILLVIITSRQLPSGKPISIPAYSIYKNFIAGAGIIESSTDNVQLSTLVGGVVKKIHVKVGDAVKAGDPLFSLDDQQAMADLKVKSDQVLQAEAALKQAEAVLNSSTDKYNLALQIKDKRAISTDDFLTRKDAHLIDKAAFDIAKENLSVVKAEENASKVNLNILTTHSPFDCHILQVNIHPGEYASTGSLATPLMLLGRVSEMHVRIDIDEYEAWRFKQNTPAIAYIRGNSQIKMDLHYVRTEPYVVPKVSLTGQSTERVDTRVLQVIYGFNPKAVDASIYIGQQVDAFIDVPEKRIEVPKARNAQKITSSFFGGPTRCAQTLARSKTEVISHTFLNDKSIGR